MVETTSIMGTTVDTAMDTAMDTMETDTMAIDTTNQDGEGHKL